MICDPGLGHWFLNGMIFTLGTALMVGIIATAWYVLTDKDDLSK